MSKYSVKRFWGAYGVWLPIGIAFLIAAMIILVWGNLLSAAAVIGALLGVWVTWGLNSRHSEQRRESEYKSLLVSFAHELVEAFHRCVLYYKQRGLENRVSYSALFNFNDASTLSKLASVTDNPNVVDAIMYLKTKYFQVGRHVVHASELATKKSVEAIGIDEILEKPQKTWTEEEQQRVEKVAKLEAETTFAQDRAIVFFTGDKSDKITYQKIKDCTSLLVNELKIKWPSGVADELESIFTKAKKLKDRIDCVIERREAKKNVGE